ncbi:glycoside hydrolase family 3 protein [Acidicapsa ligni]|uniref:glycoside hydrolase family 3 protein n=1 Tax=Acidicapsa ligni TaxID=542300 RepID=UPI0021E05BDD|nr:glycoside hydrolase family 3 protein [Acidicapsa ligni]
MKLRLLLVAISLVLPTLPVLAQQECAATLTPQQLDQKIENLIAQMTPEERIAQLQDRAPAIPRLHIPAYNWWNEGLHGIARNGYATVFPQAIGLAATFDPDLLQQVGNVVSTEARAKFNSHSDVDSARYAGLTIWSPNINIFRDPRWGRGQETYGEDPYLTGELGAHFVRGIQGPDGFYRKADATPKHFAVHSGPESIRDGFNSIVSQHDLSDTYLPAFRQLSIEGHADAMMCSYNAINGIPSCANTALLQDRVRNVWGFNGYIVSDCDAVDEVTEYLHYTADHAHGAADSLKAGTDLNCGNAYSHLNESLNQHLITLPDINRALHRLLLARLRLGMLQPADCSPYSKISSNEIDTEDHRAIALRAAEESIVLLRNNTTTDTSTPTPLLPLNLHGKRIAVIGPTADMLATIEANYHGTTRNTQTLLEELRHWLPQNAIITYAQGSTLAQGVSVPIASTAFVGNGLHAEYFPTPDLTGKPAFTRSDSRIDFDFDHISPAAQSLAAQPGTAYSIRWTGSLIPPAPGTYKLHVAVDRCFDCKGHDAYRLLIDKQLVLSDDGTKEHVPDSLSVNWQDTHAHTIQLELLHTGEDQGIHLEWEAPAEAQLAESLHIAKDADILLALVGLSPALEGEALRIKIPGFDGGDRTDLSLPEAQRKLLSELAKLHKPMVIGITSGSAVSTASIISNMTVPIALLQLWYPGEEGGHALANILSGSISPSGHLPVTIYRSIEDLPAFTDYSMSNRTYRYFDRPVEFPFGFGLSYSSFQYSAAAPSTKTLRAGQSLQVQAKVTNTGHIASDEVAELYLIPPQGSGAPRLTLQGMQRIHLNPGESRSLNFMLTQRQLSLVDTDGIRAVRPGSYKVFIGDAQPKDLTTDGTSFEITGEAIQKP